MAEWHTKGTWDAVWMPAFTLVKNQSRSLSRNRNIHGDRSHSSKSALDELQWWELDNWYLGACVKKSYRARKKFLKNFCGTKSKKQKYDDLPNCLESSQKKFGGHTTKIADC